MPPRQLQCISKSSIQFTVQYSCQLLNEHPNWHHCISKGAKPNELAFKIAGTACSIRQVCAICWEQSSSRATRGVAAKLVGLTRRQTQCDGVPPFLEYQSFSLSTDRVGTDRSGGLAGTLHRRSQRSSVTHNIFCLGGHTHQSPIAPKLVAFVGLWWQAGLLGPAT